MACGQKQFSVVILSHSWLFTNLKATKCLTTNLFTYRVTNIPPHTYWCWAVLWFWQGIWAYNRWRSKFEMPTPSSALANRIFVFVDWNFLQSNNCQFFISSFMKPYDSLKFLTHPELMVFFFFLISQILRTGWFFDFFPQIPRTDPHQYLSIDTYWLT
jgi:hypothetical protein